MSDYSDEQLIRQYISGDAKSLEILIQRYLRSIYNFVYRYARDPSGADDIAQDVFIKVWKNIKKFDSKKNFRTWIFRIARNTAMDYLKKKKCIPMSEFENAEGNNFISETISDEAPLPSELFDQADIAHKLNEAIDRLPINYQVVLLLYYREQFKFQEIAELMEESINTVKSRYRRGLLELRKFLEL